MIRLYNQEANNNQEVLNLKAKIKEEVCHHLKKEPVRS